MARHRSNSAVNSAAMTAGCCLTPRAPSPLATLAHAGESGEFGGQGWVSWHPAGVAGSPTTPRQGEARWRGAWQDDRTATRGPPPAPARGGGGGWQDGRQAARGVNLSRQGLAANVEQLSQYPAYRNDYSYRKIKV
jgi:hypothetical protein